MSRSIVVEPERLESAAANIESANVDYEHTYQAMYEQIDKMANSWQGEDNTMFTSQIKEFQNDLRQISIIMRQYCEYLKSAAKGYRQTQAELKSQASRLRTT